MARHDEAGNAVGDAGAGGQKGDAHDDVGDAQGEADDGDLHINGMGAVYHFGIWDNTLSYQKKT